MVLVTKMIWTLLLLLTHDYEFFGELFLKEFMAIYWSLSCTYTINLLYVYLFGDFSHTSLLFGIS